DEAAIVEVHRALAALRGRGSAVRNEPLNVVLRDGDTVLVEVGARVADSGRATKVAIVADVAVTDANTQREVAAEAERVLRDVGVLIDARTFAEMLGLRRNRVERAGRRSRGRGMVWLVAA